MARICPGLLLWMTVAALASRGVQAWDSKKVTREFQDIPASYVYVQQALWFAMKEYNKASKDTYVYKVMNVLRSQEQVSGSHFPPFVPVPTFVGGPLSAESS